MHKRGNPSRQRLLALRRYIRAMEQGDAETAAAVLHEAGQDWALEQMILELNIVYQEIDQSIVSAQEAHEVYHQLLTPALEQETGRLVQSNGAYALHDHPFLTAEMRQPPAKRMNAMEEPETIPMPALAEMRLPGLRKNRGGHLIRTLAVALIACALTGMILLAIAYQRAATPHAIVAVTNNNGMVYGLRADNGHQLWKFTAPAFQEGNSTGNETIVEGQVVYALLGSQVYALHAMDGTLLWHRSLSMKGTQQESYYTLLFDHNMVYISGAVYGMQPVPQENIYALRARDGAIAWHSTGFVSSLLTAHDGIAYVGTQDQDSTLELHALRGDTGQLLWRAHTYVISAVADGHTVYVYSGASLRMCKCVITEGNGGARSESMRRLAESLMHASELSGEPS